MNFISGLVLQAGWFSFILLLCFATAWSAFGIRQAFSWQALLALILFYVGVAASNAWQFIPRPTGEFASDPEAQRIWFVTANEAVHQAKMLVRDLAIGMSVIMALNFKNRARTLTWLVLWVWFCAETGESIERFVCKMNDPAFGLEHTWLATGDVRPSCGRAFGGWGSVIFPAVTFTMLPIVLWRVKSKLP